MSKQELIEKAMNGRVEFIGNVEVTQIWTGYDYLPYYAQYADKEGIHACPKGEEYSIDAYEPTPFDEVEDNAYELLAKDVINL
jgi:hypothetical protein